MKFERISDRLIYVPNRNRGSQTFEGTAKVSIEVCDIIGKEGVSYISQKIKDILEVRKELFGNSKVEFYGLHKAQYFFDLKERIFLNIESSGSHEPTNFTISIGEKYSGISRDSRRGALKTIKRGDIFHWDY